MLGNYRIIEGQDSIKVLNNYWISFFFSRAGTPRFYALISSCVLFFLSLSIASYGQCTFAITHSNTDTHCLYAMEEVVWRNASQVAILGNGITKNVALSSWDAGALSVNTVGNNGWVTSVINGVNTERMFGLSSQATVSVTPGFARSQFGIMLRTNGRFGIYESGNHRGDPLGDYGDNTYRNGDVFRIWIDKGVLKYFQNNTLLYISTASPGIPMVVDATLGTGTPNPASIGQVIVANGSNGSFTAAASNGSGSPTYQWFLDGSPAGTGTSYTNTALDQNSTLRCVRTTDGTGCPSSTIVNSNTITFQLVALNTFADYNVLTNGVEYACLAATEPAVFIDRVNTEAIGNSLTKNRGLVGWNAGAFSVNSIVNNGYVEAVVPQTDRGMYFGLSKTNPDFNAGKFAFFVRADATLEIYEANVLKTSLPGTYGPNTLLKIEVDNNVVKYYTNNVLRYISSVAVVPADFPLHVDIAFNDLNGSLNNITLSNGTSGSFSTRLTSAGSSPQYQWKRNNTDIIGATSSSYLFPTIVDQDVISCAINPNLVGCSTVTTPTVDLNEIPFKGTLYVSNAIAPIACAETVENAAFTDLVNVTVSQNDVVKFQGGNGIWSAGVTSLNLIQNNGYAKVRVDQTNTAKVFGLSSNARVLTHTSSGNSFIQYGINFRADSRFEVYEYDGTFYTIKRSDEVFNAGDEFKIKVENGVVRYYRNTGLGDQLFYTSAMVPVLPLVVDISLNTESPVLARFDDVVVSNGSSGIFNANTSSMGPSPDFQWKLNGADDGVNSQSYTNGSLVGGDKITCLITPDIAGCTTGYLSNIVEVKNIGGVTSPITIWDGSASPNWSNPDNWSNGVPNGYTKVTIPAGMPSSPQLDVANSGVYDITISPGATLAVTGNNSLTVFNAWANEGTFISNNSTIKFNTCTDNENTILSVSPEQFNTVEIDNSNGVKVSGEHHIKNHMDLLLGIVDYSAVNDLIIFDDGSTVAGASTKAYVNGKVRKIGDEAFSFPIGKSGIYAPAEISAPFLVTDQFDAEYFFSLPPLDCQNRDPNIIKTVSDCEFWNILGTSAVEVTLSWRTCPHYIISDKAHMLVVRLGDDGNGNPFWVSDGNSAASGGAGGGTVTSALASSGQIYSLGSSNLATILPIELLEFDGVRTPDGNVLRWIASSETGNEKFEIEAMTQGANEFIKIGEVSSFGKAQKEQEYSFVHQQPSNFTYYRLKLIDYDQTFDYSNVIGIKNDLGEEGFKVYPVPVSSRLYFNQVADVTVINQLGQILLREQQVTSIDVSSLMSGVYFVKTNSGITRRFIK